MVRYCHTYLGYIQELTVTLQECSLLIDWWHNLNNNNNNNNNNNSVIIKIIDENSLCSH